MTERVKGDFKGLLQSDSCRIVIMLIELRGIFRKIPYNFRFFPSGNSARNSFGFIWYFSPLSIRDGGELAFGSVRGIIVDFRMMEFPSSRIGLSLMMVGLGSILSLVLLAKGSKIYSIKAQMKDETSQYKLHFLKQLFHSIWQIICSWRGSLLAKKLHHEMDLFAGPIGKNMYTVYEGSHISPCLWCWCWLAAVYQVPLTSHLLCFETPRNCFLSCKRFVLVGLTICKLSLL